MKRLSEKLRDKDALVGTSRLLVAKAVYSFTADGGEVSTITPVRTVTLPAGAVIVGATINTTTAVTSAGSATVAVGTSAGSAANSILTATAKASLTLNALINGAATFAAPVKLSAAGSITVTVATAALTAGVVEVNVLYFVSAG